jgi:hypothetical protein
MGNWTAEVELYPIDFDGDKITFTAKRLLAADMGLVMSHYDAEKQMMRFASQMEMAEMCAEVFPKYVTKIDGMVKGDGGPFTLPEFLCAVKEAYFTPLITELFVQIMKISTVGSTEKNSAPPAPVSSEA